MGIDRKVCNHVEDLFKLRIRTRKKKNCTRIVLCVTFGCVCVCVCVCARCRFLGAFAKLRKVTVRFVMSVCLSVCPHGKTRFPLDGFLENWIFEYFSKICRENSSFFKISQTLFHMKPYAHLS